MHASSACLNTHLGTLPKVSECVFGPTIACSNAHLGSLWTAQLLPVIAAMTDEPDARLRASLAAAQLIGTAMLRHVLRVEPLATASHDEIVALVTPVIEQYVR